MRVARHILLLCIPWLLASCGPASQECPNGDCSSDYTIKDPDPNCEPKVTCNTVGARCDTIIDDCGNILDCGSCFLPYVCAGLGTPNQCENPCEGDVCSTGNKNICNSTYGGYVCSCSPGYEDDGHGNCKKQSTAVIRLVSSNLTSGARQTYKGPGIRILKGLKPDIVMLQEFNYSKSLDPEYQYENITDFVKNVFGPEFSFHRGTGTIPNGIVSRFPIKKSGQWIQESYQNRQFEYAVIDIPGDVDLWAISVHLLTDKNGRTQEAEDLVDYIQANVPKGDYVAIAGDFNTTSRNEKVYDAFRDVVTVRGEYPDDQKGNENTNADRSKTYDGIYVSEKLHKLETPVIIGNTSHESGLVFDSRKFNPLNAVSPVKAGDSGADQMQHMAVVRDFKIW